MYCDLLFCVNTFLRLDVTPDVFGRRDRVFIRLGLGDADAKELTWQLVLIIVVRSIFDLFVELIVLFLDKKNPACEFDVVLPIIQFELVG